jgi:hypothetical protein
VKGCRSRSGSLRDQSEALLSDAILKELKMRLERIGIAYQTPVRP